MSELEWRQLVEKSLRGRSFDRWAHKTYNGFSISPLYASSSEPSTLISQSLSHPLCFMARIDHPSSQEAFYQVQEEDAGEATGLSLIFDSAPEAYGWGIPLKNTLEVLNFYSDIHQNKNRQEILDPLIESLSRHNPLLIEAGEKTNHLASLIIKSYETNRIQKVVFGDPCATSLLRGEIAGKLEEHISKRSEILKESAQKGFPAPNLLIDGSCIHAAGGSEAQELAYVLALSVNFLRTCSYRNIPLDYAYQALSVSLVADTDIFLTIAKLRAMRLLWACLGESCQLPFRSLSLHVKTAWRMMTRQDPWTNILRTGLAAFGAFIGQANHLTILPFTQACGLPDNIARRLARCTFLIFLEESHLNRVQDPTAGSGAFEALTHHLCEKSWSLFQDIEKRGGFESALLSGWFQGEVKEIAQNRLKDIASGEASFIGITDFPYREENKIGLIRPFSLSQFKAMSQASSHLALSPLRLAESLEELAH